MAELAKPVDARDAAVLAAGRLGAWRLTNVRAWPAVRRFVLVLVVLYLAKQAIYVVAFRPFSGHDEVAHYSYLRTVATEGRVPILVKDRLHNDLYPYCDFILHWSPCDPRYIGDPPEVATYPGFGAHPVDLQYAADHPHLYYILMTPLY